MTRVVARIAIIFTGCHASNSSCCVFAVPSRKEKTNVFVDAEGPIECLKRALLASERVTVDDGALGMRVCMVQCD